MPIRQAEHRDRTVSPELEVHNKRDRIVADTAPPPTEHNPVTDATAVRFRFRILVVDDEPSIRDAVREILEGRGYEVLTAADGLDGLQALSKSLPDLIISDLNMPRMSGFEFLTIVRERFPHIAYDCDERRV
jgi:PleD family two-component response regulator